MTITRELLLVQKAAAVALRDQRCSELNAAIGAINNLDHLLAVLDLPETPQKPTKSPAG